MIACVQQSLRAAWEPYSRRPFPTLLRVFIGRVFHGGGESGASEMDVALGVVLILLALPGVMVSLLLFEKYGSLIRWMRGDGVFDPFTATIPDEYFFIVLSMVVTGTAAIWRWDALFLDRRDYTNIIPLPISLRRIFVGNFAAILLLAAALTLDVNAASFVLFPIAVVGSQNSLSLFPPIWGRACRHRRACQRLQFLRGVRRYWPADGGFALRALSQNLVVRSLCDRAFLPGSSGYQLHRPVLPRSGGANEYARNQFTSSRLVFGNL